MHVLLQYFLSLVLTQVEFKEGNIGFIFQIRCRGINDTEANKTPQQKMKKQPVVSTTVKVSLAQKSTQA